MKGVGALNLTGSAGSNVLTGKVAANRIAGGLGADRILGGGGADVINGGAGRDVMTGGAGMDVFVLAALTDMGFTVTTRDSITDFTRLSDNINLHAFMAGGAFVGELTGGRQVVYNAATHILSGSTDADAAAERAVLLQAGAVVTAADMVF